MKSYFYSPRKKTKLILAQRGPRDATYARAWACGGRREAGLQREMAHGGGILRALVILQKRPRISPQWQLSTNTIFSSLRTSHLTL